MDVGGVERTLQKVKERYHYRLYLDSVHADIGTLASGHWGHKGVPGQHGGSLKGSGGKQYRSTNEKGEYTSAAKQRAAEKKQKKQGQSEEEQAKKRELEKYGEDRKTAQGKYSELTKVVSEMKDIQKTAQRLQRINPTRLEKMKARATELEEKRKTLEAEIRETLGKHNITSPVEQQLYLLDIDNNPVTKRETPLNEDEIVKTLAGGDMTDGSCASVGLAYVAQKMGFDARDFRGGISMASFSKPEMLFGALKECGPEPIVNDSSKNSITNAKMLLNKLEDGVEYYVVAGKHASIVKVVGGKAQFLELQKEVGSGAGWTNFDGNVRYTFNTRFGCKDNPNSVATVPAYAYDISKFDPDKLETFMRYINTEEQNQKKGRGGSAK